MLVGLWRKINLLHWEVSAYEQRHHLTKPSVGLHLKKLYENPLFDNFCAQSMQRYHEKGKVAILQFGDDGVASS